VSVGEPGPDVALRATTAVGLCTTCGRWRLQEAGPGRGALEPLCSRCNVAAWTFLRQPSEARLRAETKARADAYLREHKPGVAEVLDRASAKPDLGAI
jgi:hypothetical protein